MATSLKVSPSIKESVSIHIELPPTAPVTIGSSRRPFAKDARYEESRQHECGTNAAPKDRLVN